MSDARALAEIQVRPYEFQQIEDPNYLKVHTYPRPTDRTVRLALVEWIAGRSGDLACKRLVNRKPISHEDAMAYAKRFAEEFEVPVIYERMDPDR